ncbi:hypothetical protein H6P81_005808 [Aristolochia fimbriata]|uniref:Secreted protein n=1 Tax=Aristolochia fimbriata TaxID=158543 RepID=A0AAV7EWY1_ARIFI|nr:hypothetical protein H6P81_005808 [Aristolochia fimbriata]
MAYCYLGTAALRPVSGTEAAAAASALAPKDGSSSSSDIASERKNIKRKANWSADWVRRRSVAFLWRSFRRRFGSTTWKKSKSPAGLFMIRSAGRISVGTGPVPLESYFSVPVVPVMATTSAFV